MMKKYTKNDKRRGVVLIEAALVFPILLMLTFGVIEYGWLFLRMETVTNAARGGVRLAVTPDVTDPQEVIAAVNNMLINAGFPDSADKIEVTNLNVEPGEIVTVRIDVPYESLTGAPLFPVPDQIVGRVTMAKEGPP